MSGNKEKKLLPKESTGRSRYRNDLLLLSLIFVAAIFGVVLTSFLRNDGKSVIVSVDGEVFGQYPLSLDAEIEIASGEDGNKKNILVISDGRAYVKDADCPNHDCVRARAISREGETIICIPNRVVVSVD